MSRKVNQQDSQHVEWLGEIAKGTDDMANGVGLAEHSFLDQGVHQKLATDVQKLAAEDARLELKRKATSSALKSLAADMDKRAAKGPAAAGADDPPAEQMDMAYFLETMQSKLSSAMQGADQKALESKKYKDLMKKIIPPDDDDDEEDLDIVPASGNQVSLKCPCTSAIFVDPVKNRVCGHTYSRAAILNHIKIGSKKQGGASCPVAGCSHKITASELVEDKDMKRRLRIESNTQDTKPEQDAEEIDDDLPVGETCI